MLETNQRFLCLCSLHVDNTSEESTSSLCGGGEHGAQEALSMLLGERAMADGRLTPNDRARSRRRRPPTDEPPTLCAVI
jgi:hypothetical protein